MANGPRPPKLETLDDIRVWAIDHDATVRSAWAEQRRWNEKVESQELRCSVHVSKKLEEISVRVNNLEKRVMMITGGAVVVATIVNTIVSKFFLT